jgi:phosphatidate cytidylyltransferase
MKLLQDQEFTFILAGLLVLLLFASGFSAWLSRFNRNPAARPSIVNLRSRIRAWWVMVIVLMAALLMGKTAFTILSGLVSLQALREFITLTPTRRGDHRALFWVFFIVTPIQYYLIEIEWYGLFGVFIPVYAFLFIPLRTVLQGDSLNFLERTAKIQWGLMVCVYCVSHVPALLTLHLSDNQADNAKLLIFFLLIVQLSDVLQYVWGKTCGKRKIASMISPNKTWEGFIGGVLSVTLLAVVLTPLTPFKSHEAALYALLLALLGFGGGLIMSAIKRDRGVKDYGTLIEGHGGVLDRIDSICFAAPVFFHLVRYCHSI